MTRIYGAGIAVALFCASALAHTAGAKLDHVIIAVRDLDASKRA